MKFQIKMASLIKIILKGKPRSTNNIYKTMCRGNYPNRYLSSEGKVLKNDYQWQAKQQWKGKPLETDLIMSIILFFDNHRRNDWDNFHKLSMDSLSGIVYVDDSQIQAALVMKQYDKHNPRIEILIKEL